MLTRLEVNGFKNLLGLTVDFGPFTCIAGENGTGKSNVFDAIQFLSLLADTSMMEAAQRVRGLHDERLGDPRDLFWNGYEATDRRMSFAAEMIVPREIEDDFGRPANPTISFLRYELEIGYEAPAPTEKIGRLRLLKEQLLHINQGDAPSRLRFPHSVKEFRSKVVAGRRSGAAFISTHVDSESGEPVVSIHQDGGSRGQPRPAAASRAPATVISTVTRSDDPTALSARREMQSWRRLALEPSALRTSDRYVDPRVMGADGRHSAGALYRVAMSDPNGHPEKVYARTATRLGELAGVEVHGIDVEADDVRELMTIYLTEASGLRLPARSLSEGTLRFLALCILLEDASVEGLLCMEEPENGIHPANLPSMVRLIQDLAVEASSEPGPDNPFRQVIVNTHSPWVVQLVEPANLLFAATMAATTPSGARSRGLVLRPLEGTWRAVRSGALAVTKADILPYLTAPAGVQLSLPGM